MPGAGPWRLLTEHLALHGVLEVVDDGFEVGFVDSAGRDRLVHVVMTEDDWLDWLTFTWTDSVASACRHVWQLLADSGGEWSVLLATNDDGLDLSTSLPRWRDEPGP